MELYSRWVPLTVGIIIKARGATLKITDLALLRFLSQWASACVPRSEKSFPAKLSIFVGIIIKASGATLKVTDLIKGELQSVIVILFFVLTIAFQSDKVYMDL